MTRTMAIALAFGLIGSAAVAAAPQRQLVAPNFNPGLRTVPSVASAQNAAAAAGECDRQLVNRIDSGTVITGPDGWVAHVTGMATAPAGGAQLVITSTDGQSANADLVACRSAIIVDTTAPVATSLSLQTNSGLRSIIVRAQSNSLVLYTPAGR
ncbi:MAG: hypothetical protein ABL996_13125 [Micropepsaceae bacterium]